MKSAKDLKEMIDSCYTYGGADEDSTSTDFEGCVYNSLTKI